MAANASYRILLVEDDEIAREAMTRELSRRPPLWTLDIARDGVEALEMLRAVEERARPHLLLIDLSMPRMGGLELLTALRGDATLSDTIVFVFTSSGAECDRADAYRLHAAGYFVKGEVEAAALLGLLEHYATTVVFSPTLEPRN